MYTDGMSCAQFLILAIKYLTLSSLQIHTHAQTNFGMFNLKGLGCWDTSSPTKPSPSPRMSVK